MQWPSSPCSKGRIVKPVPETRPGIDRAPNTNNSTIPEERGLQEESGPTNEAQVRPLTGLEPEQQREVWDKAVETALPSSTPGGRVKVVLNDGDKNLIASSTHLRILLDSFLLPRKDQHYANSPQYPHSP